MTGLETVLAIGLSTLVQTQAPPATESRGISEKYPGDVGIGKDPSVVFSEDFEAWEPDSGKPPGGTWDAATEQIAAVPGSVSVGGKEIPGKQVFAAWSYKGGRPTAGLEKHLGNYNHSKSKKGPGHDELYVRYYQKLDAAYTPVGNHGANLGGRDVTRGSEWVGQAGRRDVAKSGYFYSGLQSYNKRDGKMYWGFYSYHMDKKDAWGDDYAPKEDERRYIETNRWYCLERRMKLNSTDPTAADGLEELWVDGELAFRREGLRFRDVARLKISFFGLHVYYGKVPETYTAENSLKVYFDHLVIAKERIGCISPP